MTTEMPVFKSIDQMMAFAQKQKAKKSKTTQKRTVDRKKDKPYSDPTPKEELSDSIYRTTHFYLRPGDTFTQLLKDGRGELERCGPGSLVVIHNHVFSNATCVAECRSLV